MDIQHIIDLYIKMVYQDNSATGNNQSGLQLSQLLAMSINNLAGKWEISANPQHPIKYGYAINTNK